MTGETSQGPGASDIATDLDESVLRTEGVQPGRRLFHAVSGLTIVALLVATPLGRTGVLIVLGTALVAALSIDWVRLRSPAANVRFFKLLRPFASPRERDRVASSTWYLVGVIATLIIAPISHAVSAILVLALADPTASVIGRLWGRRRLGSGTVLGTSAFLLVALTILLARHPPALAVPAAALMAAAESARLPLDDNLVVPVAAALILMGLQLGLGALG